MKKIKDVVFDIFPPVISGDFGSAGELSKLVDNLDQIIIKFNR